MGRSAFISSDSGMLKPLRGYPKRQPFTSMRDVKLYLANDTVVCLLCGRHFVKLSNHVLAAHKIASDDYKIRFGIPLTYGLAGKPYRDAQKRRARRMRKQGILPSPSPAMIKRWLLASRTRRPMPTATRNDKRKMMLRLHRRRASWLPSDYKEFLRRCKSGRAPYEVGADKDMPAKKTFQRYLKRNPSLKKRYDEIWEALPFTVQVRANKTGQRYRRTIVRLRLTGKTWNQVAQEMGLGANTVRAMWHSLNHSGRIKDYR